MRGSLMEPILFRPRSGPAELFDSMFVTVCGSDCIKRVETCTELGVREYDLSEESPHERN